MRSTLDKSKVKSHSAIISFCHTTVVSKACATLVNISRELVSDSLLIFSPKSSTCNLIGWRVFDNFAPKFVNDKLWLNLWPGVGDTRIYITSLTLLCNHLVGVRVIFFPLYRAWKYYYIILLYHFSLTPFGFFTSTGQKKPVSEQSSKRAPSRIVWEQNESVPSPPPENPPGSYEHSVSPLIFQHV